jgi:PAS domain S-box-containing protein
MNSAASEQETGSWLANDVLKEQELMLRSVLSHQSEAILIVDHKGRCLDASFGACRLLGVPASKLIGQFSDDLAKPGRLRSTVMNDVLPGRNIISLHAEGSHSVAADYAFLSLDPAGRIVAWSAGAERLYGYTSEEMVEKDASCLFLDDLDPLVNQREELRRTASEGHLGNEAWHSKSDGARFWANSLTTAPARPSKWNTFARMRRGFEFWSQPRSCPRPHFAGLLSCRTSPSANERRKSPMNPGLRMNMRRL